LIGTTPLLLSNVAAGARHLRIELSGYQIWTTAVQIKPSGRFRVSARLEP
jgi:PEGA domain